MYSGHNYLCSRNRNTCMHAVDVCEKYNLSSLIGTLVGRSFTDDERYHKKTSLCEGDSEMGQISNKI
jgi:hypothetical protein